MKTKLTYIVLVVILFTTLSFALEKNLDLNKGWNLIRADVEFNGQFPADEVLSDTLIHFPNPRRTGVDMSILIASLDGIQVIEGAELGCLTEAGLVAGAKALDPNQDRWGMAVWGDDSWTPDTIDGFVFDEPLTFLYWDPEFEEELEIEVEVVEGHGLTFRSGEILIIGMHVSVDETNVIHPDEFSLTPIYPNPFNSEAKFSYTLNRPGTVNLKMYDLSGRLVGNLYEGRNTAGIYTATISGDHLRSGMYLVVLDLDGEKRSIRALLLK